MTPSAPCLARVLRSGRVESEHFGQIALCDSDGQIVKAFGDVEIATYMRSAAKPFQAVTVLESGAGERFDWSDEELAVVIASHTAEADHLRLVRSILQKAELTENDLGCGPHPPIHPETRDAIIRAGQKPTRIHNNCSGKHAGMLAACVTNAWPTKSYLEPSHPLQVANRESVRTFARLDSPSIPVGVDGCGVPTFYLSVRAIATMYARLAVDANDLPLPVTPARRVSRVMRDHPRLISGTDRFADLLVTNTQGRIITKDGAEGVIGIAVPELSLGLAIKCSDGNNRAIPAIVCRILAEIVPDLDWARIESVIVRPILNTRGENVGRIECSL